ncbi:redoxin family protein [Amycolatopsis sp. NPDC051758]|uniref:redoxin family protein n=1 Tax=Amycolatopsis sp. NPDC051758 TaxID=3363935 RepID=UPI00378E2C54
MARVPLRTMRVSVAVAVCAATVLAGCAAKEQTAGPPATQQISSTPPAENGASSVPEALRFTAKTVDGKDFNGEALAGKPAVMWFWASWCPKCQAEAPGVRNAAEATAGSVTFLGVAALSDVPAMRGFVDRYQVGGFTHLADEGAAIWKRFGVAAQPAYAFIGAGGTVEVVTDRVSADQLLDRARALAGGGSR